MTLTELLELCDCQTLGDLNVLHAACSPELVAALVRCVYAADAMRQARAQNISCAVYGEARAELDRLLGEKP